LSDGRAYFHPSKNLAENFEMINYNVLYLVILKVSKASIVCKPSEPESPHNNTTIGKHRKKYLLSLAQI
jgi:hypothetical protein